MFKKLVLASALVMSNLSYATGPIEECRDYLYANRPLADYFWSTKGDRSADKQRVFEIFDNHYKHSQEPDFTVYTGMVNEYNSLKWGTLLGSLLRGNVNLDECYEYLQEHFQSRPSQEQASEDSQVAGSFEEWLNQTKTRLEAVERVDSPEYIALIQDAAKYLVSLYPTYNSYIEKILTLFNNAQSKKMSYLQHLKVLIVDVNKLNTSVLPGLYQHYKTKRLAAEVVQEPCGIEKELLGAKASFGHHRAK